MAANRNTQNYSYNDCLSWRSVIALVMTVVITCAPVQQANAGTRPRLHLLMAQNVMGGAPADQDMFDAVRFLQHATFGPTFGGAGQPASVTHVVQVGFDAWLTSSSAPRLCIPTAAIMPICHSLPTKWIQAAMGPASGTIIRCTRCKGSSTKTR